VCHRAYRDIRVSDGNHFVSRRGNRLAERSDHPLEFLHFPLRSLAQLERKIRQGAEALQANARVARGIGSHWRRIYRDYFVSGRLAEYYETCAPTAEQIAAGLPNGEFVEDTRIRDALSRIDPALAEPDSGAH
jgi:hypothetical protein